jgi:RNA polymerase sigma factor (sigma-70 family)
MRRGGQYRRPPLSSRPSHGQGLGKISRAVIDPGQDVRVDVNQAVDCVSHRCAKLARDNARREVVAQRAVTRDLAPQAAAPTANPLDAVDDRDLVQQALATLAAEEREAIALRYGADLTLPEIAALIKEPLSTAEGRVYRGLRKLRKTLS